MSYQTTRHHIPEVSVFIVTTVRIPNAKNKYRKYQKLERGRDSVVGIATRYGLDGPGIESR
jgi:hypothetical protein